MRSIILLFCIFISNVNSFAQQPKSSPLVSFSSKWNDTKYNLCNTAANIKYMNDSEKQVIYILNLARMNPKLFCETVVKHYPSIYSHYDYENSDYFRSLIAELDSLQPLNIIKPDSACARSAQAHATTSGKIGYTGHVRQTKEASKATHFMGECCDYGHERPLDIIMSLLIDQNVASLGHRRICLEKYTKMGVGIQPHSVYKHTATLDFYF